MGPDLRVTVVAILNQFQGKPPTAELELDHVHRVLGPRTPPSSQVAHGPTALPCDILCRVHFFNGKEEILHQAWDRDSIDFDSTLVRVYPDVSRQIQAM